MRNALVWFIRLLVAGILLQTLFFKFTGAAESVYIFQTLGIEPWGRIASGVAELVAAALILWPPTTGTGAVLSLGVISGAIVSHLTKLGIEVQGDGGLLFYLALVVFAGSRRFCRKRSVVMAPSPGDSGGGELVRLNRSTR